MKRIPLLLFFAFCLLAGCKKPSAENGSGNQNTNPGTQPSDEPYFTVKDFPDTIKLYSAMDVQAYCNTSYSDEEIVVSASEAWPIIYRVNNIVHIEVPYWGADEKGNVPSPRSCTVTIKAGQFSQTARLIQESDKATAGPGLHGKTVQISPMGETITLPVTSQCISWMATTSADWISVKALDNYLEITSLPKKDVSASKRKAEVLVRSTINIKNAETVFVEDSDSQVEPGNYGYDDNHSNWD